VAGGEVAIVWAHGSLATEGELTGGSDKSRQGCRRYQNCKED
jgi:hypothetical protein